MSFIVIFEILLVTWLPSQLITRELWDKEVALQELINLEDSLRREIRDMEFNDKWHEGEAHMTLDCLNENAKYLRKHQSDMSLEQIKELYAVLKEIETRYNQWKTEKYCISFERIDIKPLMKQALEKYNNDTK